MENEKEQNQLSADKFYLLLSKMKAVSPIYEKIMKHLVKSLAPEISDDAQKVLYIYFSLLEDGNTRIPLDSEKLLEKWNKKWSGLVIQDKSQDKYNELQIIDLEDNNCFNKQIFDNGINDLLEFGKSSNKKTGLPRHLTMARNDGYVNNLILYIDKEGIKSEVKDNSLFVIDGSDGIKYLYANKYYEAKLIIEEKIKQLFHKSIEASSHKIITNKDIEDITLSKDFKLNYKQLDAVNRGQNENIIITGGPGTGKTTVVFYILWFLLEQEKYYDYNIYLTAPSGKASDRVKESLLENLNRVSTDINNNIITKLNLVDCYTIHRLLKYNPVTGKFKYNKDNKFDVKSIFVIDEASMIDISMFSNLLEAINDNSRIFILGDIDQLPSVDAGAVLGDLLKSDHFVVELTESKRFSASSNIGKLKEYIHKIKEKQFEPSSNLQSNDVYMDNFELFNPNKIYWKLEKDLNNEYKKQNQVKLISLIEDITLDLKNRNNNIIETSLRAEGVAIQKNLINNHLNNRTNINCFKKYRFNLDNILTKWIQTFFYDDNESICEIAEKVNPLIENSNEQDEIRDRLWKMSLRSKILCAEKQSITGLDNINKFIYRYIYEQCLKSDIKLKSNSKYFPGQLLIITRNQEMYRLYNGDTGVVVTSNNGVDYLMVKKNEKFEFYPLTIFPIDSIENAFAITVHKSQGSEYDNILMFLPNMPGHRVLSNQIIYTGITRAKDSATIVSTKEAFDFACSNVINRDTGIVLF
jgi:exodeoxyribonuclease V alpha subunit